MRNKDKLRLNPLRDVLAQVVNASKTAKPVISDGDLCSVLRSSIAKRHHSAASFKANDRMDLAEIEEAEVDVLVKYLPSQMDEREIEAIVVDVASRIGASQTELGKVLAALKDVLDESRAPKSVVVPIVKKVLAGASSKSRPA